MSNPSEKTITIEDIRSKMEEFERRHKIQRTTKFPKDIKSGKGNADNKR